MTLRKESLISIGGEIQEAEDLLDVRHYHAPDDVEIFEDKQWMTAQDQADLINFQARLNSLETGVGNELDFDPPGIANTSMPNIESLLNNSNIVIEYQDNVRMSPGTIGRANIEVTGPSTIVVNAASTAQTVFGPNMTATYGLSPTDGQWSVNDNGTYTVSLVENQVFDSAGNAMAAQIIGTFDCLIDQTGMIFSGNQMTFAGVNMEFTV